MATVKKPSGTTSDNHLTRRSFFGVAVQGPAMLGLPGLISQSACAAANDDHSPIDPTFPGGAASRPNPHNFPNEDRDQVDLLEFYGNPRDDSQLVRVQTPYSMQISFLPGKHRSFLWAHQKVADSLASVLNRVHEHYGDKGIERLGLNVFGGDHVDRQMTGANRWSTHAYGIAFDFDPQNNAYQWSRKKARFAHPVYDDWWTFWKDEGWFALGPELDFDFMHIQAAIRTY
ncbi:MAG: hypothetical protein ABJC67_07935 [Lentilitoribacter sp.]